MQRRRQKNGVGGGQVLTWGATAPSPSLPSPGPRVVPGIGRIYRGHLVS